MSMDLGLAAQYVLRSQANTVPSSPVVVLPFGGSQNVEGSKGRTFGVPEPLVRVGGALRSLSAVSSAWSWLPDVSSSSTPLAPPNQFESPSPNAGPRCSWEASNHRSMRVTAWGTPKIEA